MEELRKIDDKKDNIHSYYSPDYYEPLLEYVEIIADIYKPLTPEDYECGLITSKAQGNFVYRYFENKIDKSFEEKFLDKDIQETITALGYDVDKFWYLLLFVYDFSCGMCVNGIVPNKSPKEHLKKLSNAIFENLETYDGKTNEISFKSSAKIILEIKGKHKISIEDPNAIYHLAEMLLLELDKFKTGSFLSQSKTEVKTKNGKIEGVTSSDSFYICYVANMLLKFFDLNPPKKTKQKKGTSISSNKYLFVSRLIKITGLSDNMNLVKSDMESSEDSLKGYLNQFKRYKFDMINSLYF